MFERFPSESRQVVVLAQEEAIRLRHNYVGTEHLLLALLAQGEAAGSLVASKGLDLERAREWLVDTIGKGQVAPAGHIPFTPRAKQALELAGKASTRLRSQQVTPSHLLLGLLHLADGAAYSMLVDAGISPDDLQKDMGPVNGGSSVSYLELALQAVREGSEALRTLVQRDYEPSIDETLVRFVIGQRLSSLASWLQADVKIERRESVGGRTVHVDLTLGDPPYVGIVIRHPRGKPPGPFTDELTRLVADARSVPYPTLVVTLLDDDQLRELGEHDSPWPLEAGQTADAITDTDEAATTTVACLAIHSTGLDTMYVFGVEVPSDSS